MRLIHSKRVLLSFPLCVTHKKEKIICIPKNKNLFLEKFSNDHDRNETREKKKESMYLEISGNPNTLRKWAGVAYVQSLFCFDFWGFNKRKTIQSIKRSKLIIIIKKNLVVPSNRAGGSEVASSGTWRSSTKLFSRR